MALFGLSTAGGVRRVPTSVVRINFSDRLLQEIGEAEEMMRVAKRFWSHIRGRVEKNGGITFRVDLAKYLIAVPEDVNPGCREFACRVAIDLMADVPKFWKPGPVNSGSSLGSAAFVGIDFAPLFWAPSLGDPALGAVIDSVAKCAELAESRGIPILASMRAVDGIVGEFSYEQLRGTGDELFVQLKGSLKRH